MVLFKTDYKREKAKELIKSLDETNENNSLIKYYINKLEQENQEKRRELNDYKHFFNELKRFIPDGKVKY